MEKLPVSRPSPLIERYAKNPSLRALVQVASGCTYGVAGAIETAILVTFENAREERQRAFFDELNEKDVELTEEKIKNEDFIYFWLATMKSVNFTREREKIKLFASLFLNFSKGNNFEKVCDYEEWLAVLNDLSYREFQLLMFLKYKFPEQPLSLEKLQAFYGMIEKELGIKANEVEGWFFRLERTGLCGNNGGFDGGIFEVRPNFESFLQMIQYADTDFKIPENANR